MASIIITDIDEQAKQSFEQLCASFNMNMAMAFNALVKIGMSIKEQGLFAETTAKTAITHVETRSQAQLAAFERFVATNRAITDEPISAEFDSIIASGVNFAEGMDL